MSLKNLEYKGKKFKKAPIVEAIFEMRFPINLSIDTKKDQFYNFIKAEFPDIKPPQPTPFEHHLIQPIGYYSTTGKKNLNCSVSKFSVITREYNTFQDFKQSIVKYVTKLAELYGIQEITRLGLRYINRIEAKSGNFNKYLNFNFALPESLSKNELQDFQTLLNTKLEKGHLRTIIAKDKKELGNYLLLDNDVIFEGVYEVKLIDGLLAEMHEKIETVFLDMLVKEYVEEII